MHDLSVIVTLAGALAVALVFGAITQRLGLSTLVGYMLAGVVVGPYTPGFVADARLASQMAEIGVILLMFGVGMHFHPQELLRVWRIAVPGAIAQSAVAGVAGWWLARGFGWSHAAGVVFGMALAVASTVVLMRMLLERDRVSTHEGHVAVGWLIVEDLFTVGALVLLPALAAGETVSFASLGGALGKAALFAVLVWAVGTRLVAPLMERVARLRSSELFTLTVFVVALGIAISPPRCSTFRWRSAPSSPAWSSASRASGRRRPPTWLRSATCSRRCSSSRSACSSIRRCSSRSRC
jgi:K+:H+ antiporter